MTVHFTYFERTPSKSQIIAEDAFDKELFFDVPGKTGVKRACLPDFCRRTLQKDYR
ncbi:MULTISPECIES: hypothetical protein [unclassified Microcoleus]|uniref:hypothetical protein n=1 Tax=unclassified Microcoleus TaxID=2642155 RepID=UPI002FD00B59